MGIAGVLVDGGCGLGAEVACLWIEIECADAVGAMRTGELHAALDALDAVGFHCLNCNCSARGGDDSLVGQRR